MLQEWWTRDHLSAISAISPAGKLYFPCQDQAINSTDVIAFLEHLLPRGAWPAGDHVGWRARSTIAISSKSSWPLARRHGSRWSASPPMPQN